MIKQERFLHLAKITNYKALDNIIKMRGKTYYNGSLARSDDVFIVVDALNKKINKK